MSTPHWSRIEKLPEYETWTPEEKVSMFDQWEQDFTGEVLAIGSDPEILDGLRSDNLSYRFRIANPDKQDDEEAWKSFAKTQWEQENKRLTGALPTFKDLFNREDAPPTVLTEDGVLLVNPRLLGKKDRVEVQKNGDNIVIPGEDLYRKAVLESDAPATAKADALRYRDVWERKTHDELLAAYSTVLQQSDPNKERIRRNTLKDGEYDQIKVVNDVDGNPRRWALVDPRHASFSDQLSTPGFNTADITLELLDFDKVARTAEAAGIDINSVVDRHKKYYLWGSPEDPGNLYRRDPVAGNVIINPVPMNRDGVAAPQLLWDKKLAARELARLKPTEEEKVALDAELERYKDSFSNSLFDVFMATSTAGHAGVDLPWTQGARSLRDMSSDFKAFAIANKDKPKREVVEAYMKIREGMWLNAKVVEAIDHSVRAGVLKIESGVTKLAALASDVVSLPFVEKENRMALSRKAAVYYAPLEQQAQLMEGVSSVPFGSDVVNEAGMIGVTGVLGKGAQFAARPLISSVATRTMLNPGGKVARGLMLVSDDAARLQPRISEVLPKFIQLGDELALKGADKATAAAAIHNFATAVDAPVRQALTKAIAQIPMTATVYGTASARSGSATYADAYLSYRQAALDRGLTAAEAEAEATDAALLPTLGSMIITPLVMKAVPGGTERLFGVGKKGLDELTLGQVLKATGEKGIIKAFRAASAKQLLKATVPILYQGGREAFEEGLDETGQVLVSLATYRPDMTLGEGLKQIGTAFALGGLMGTASTGISSAMDRGVATPPPLPAGRNAPTAPSAPSQSTPPQVAPSGNTVDPNADVTPEEEDAAAVRVAVAQVQTPAPNVPNPQGPPVTPPPQANPPPASSGAVPPGGPGAGPAGTPAANQAAAPAQAANPGAPAAEESWELNEDGIPVPPAASDPTPEPITPAKQLASGHAAANPLTPAVNAAFAAAAARPPQTPPQTPPQGTPETGAQAKPGGKAAGGKVPDVTVKVPGASIDTTLFRRGETVNIKQTGPDTYEVWEDGDKSPMEYSADDIADLGQVVDAISKAAPAATPTPTPSPAPTGPPTDPLPGGPPVAPAAPEAGAAPAPLKAVDPVTGLDVDYTFNPESRTLVIPKSGGLRTALKAVLATAKDPDGNPVVRNQGVRVIELKNGNLRVTMTFSKSGSRVVELSPSQEGNFVAMGGDALSMSEWLAAPAPAPAPAVEVNETPAPAEPKAPKAKKETTPKKTARPKVTSIKPKDARKPFAEVSGETGVATLEFIKMAKDNGAVPSARIIQQKYGGNAQQLQAFRQMLSDKTGIPLTTKPTEGTPLFDLESAQSKKKRAEQLVRNGDTLTKFTRQAEKLASRLLLLKIPDTELAKSIMAGSVEVLIELRRIVRSVFSEGDTRQGGSLESGQEAVERVVELQTLRDFGRRAFAAEALALPEVEQDAWILSQFANEGDLYRYFGWSPAAVDRPSVDSLLAKIKTNWPTLVFDGAAARARARFAALDYMKRVKSETKTFGAQSSLDENVGEDGGTSRGDLVSEEDVSSTAAPYEPPPLTDSAVAKIKALAASLNIEGTDPHVLAQEITKYYFTEDGRPRPTYIDLINKIMDTLPDSLSDEAAQEKAQLTAGKIVGPAIRHSHGYLRTRTNPADDLDAGVRELLTNLGIDPANPASIITALERIAADPKGYGNTAAENAKEYLKYLKDNPGYLKDLVIGGDGTYYDRASWTITIGTTTRNSWGTTNGLLEEIGHHVRHIKWTKMTPEQRAQAVKDAVAQINKARENLEAFKDWIQETLAAEGLDPNMVNRLLDDLYYSLGLEVHRVVEDGGDPYGDVDYIEDWLTQGPAKVEAAYFEFTERTLTDPFTKRVLGTNKDFSNGLFAFHAKRRFNMVPDRQSPKGKLLQATLGAEGDDKELLEEKISELGGGVVLGTRATEEMTLDMDRGRLLSLLGERLYNAKLPTMINKEVMQNSFDAIKEAEEQGIIAPGAGKIYVTSQTDGDSIKVRFVDNGVGMTPAIVRKAFFTVGGTHKESTKRSGGFGLAKLGIFMSSSRVLLETTRDGKRVTADVTSDQLRGGDTWAVQVDDAPENAPNGTSVTLWFPKKWVKADGSEASFYPEAPKSDTIYHNVSISYGQGYRAVTNNEELDAWFNGAATDVPSLSGNSPRKSLEEYAKAGYTEVPIAANGVTARVFHKRLGLKNPDGSNRHYGTIAFADGTSVEVRNSQMQVLSNGLLQFTESSLKVNPLDWNSDYLPYSIIVDIDAGNVPTESTAYPFTNNREGFIAGAPIAKEIDRVLTGLRQLEQLASFKAEFEIIRSLDGGAPTKSAPVVYNNTTVDMSPEEEAFMRDFSTWVHNAADSVVSHLQRGTAEGYLPAGNKWERTALNKAKSDISAEEIAEVKARIKELEAARVVAEEAASEAYRAWMDHDISKDRDEDARLEKIYKDLKARNAEVDQEIERLAAIIDSEGSASLSYYYGGALSRNWGGVHTGIEPRVVLVNPVYVASNIINGREAMLAGSWWHLVMHEVNHIDQRNEGAGFTYSLLLAESYLSNTVTDSGRTIREEHTAEVLELIRTHRDAIITLKEKFDESETKNNDLELTGDSVGRLPAPDQTSRGGIPGRRDPGTGEQLLQDDGRVEQGRPGQTGPGSSRNQGGEPGGSGSESVTVGDALTTGSRVLGTRTSEPRALTPPISMFRSRQQLAEMRGVFKALTADKNGTVPWQNLSAKITKGFKKVEADMVLAAVEPMVASGRVKVEDAIEAMDALARASVQVVKLTAKSFVNKPATAERDRLSHELDTVWPGWQASIFTGEEGAPVDPPGASDLDIRRIVTPLAPSRHAVELYVQLRHASRAMVAANRQNLDDHTEESATGRFPTVNPKPLDQMPGAQDITVEEPLTRTMDSDERAEEEFMPASDKAVYGIKFSEGTHFPTRKNVIGFARMYTETLNGTEGTFVFEVQSDWAAKMRREQDNLEAARRDGTSADVVELIKGDVQAMDTPLLQIHETLSLKAAIADARAKGQTWVAVTDAETAMMTEGHDKSVKVTYHYKAPPSSMAKLMDYRNENLTSLDTDTVFTLEVLADRGMMNTAKKPLPADIVSRFGLTEQITSARPTQEPGMRAAYDPKIGRLHAIMRKLTGDKGKPVNFGPHQNQQGDKVYATLEERDRVYKAAIAEGLTPDQANARAFAKVNKGSPVFNGKTDITAVAYDITKVDDKELTALFTRTAPEGRIPYSKVLEQNSSAYRAFVENVKVEFNTRDVRAVDYRDEETGDLITGVLVSPDWEAVLSKPTGDETLDAISKALLSQPIGEFTRNRPLFIEYTSVFHPVMERYGKPFRVAGWHVSDNDRSTQSQYAFDRAKLAVFIAADTDNSTAPAFISTLKHPGDKYFDEVVRHELIHTLTVDLLNRSRAFKSSISDLLSDARQMLHPNRRFGVSWKYYGLTNEREFLAEAFSNPEFARLLTKTPARVNYDTTLWDKFIQLLGKFFGGINPSILDVALRDTLDVMERRGAEVVGDTERLTFFNRIDAFRRKHAPLLLNHWTNIYRGNTWGDVRLKVPMVQSSDIDFAFGPDARMESKMLYISEDLITRPGEAERLIRRENAYLEFRHTLNGEHFNAIANAPDKVAFLPILNDAAVSPEAAQDLLETMDEEAIEVILRHMFNTYLGDEVMDALDVKLATRTSPETTHPIPGSPYAFIKDAEGNVLDYTDSYDPSIPKAMPNLADRLEHARIQGGLNATRLGTRVASEQGSRVPVSHAPLRTRATKPDNRVGIPTIGDNVPIPRGQKDAGIFIGPVQWTWWSGRETLAEQGGWKKSGWFRYGKLPVSVKAMDRTRHSLVAAAQSLGENFAKESRDFIDQAIKGGMDERAAIELVNDALGSTRNWTDPATAKRLDNDRKAANKVAQGTFLSNYHQVTALRKAGDPAGADALHETMVNDLRATIAQNRADMEAALQADRDLRFRQTKNRQTAAHRQILALDPEFHEKLVFFRREITAKGREIARTEIELAQALRGRVPDATYQAALGKAIDLKATIDHERGLWLHRTYRLHKDPKWYDRVMERHPDLAPVIAEAEAFIRQDLIERHTKRLLHENRLARADDPTVPKLTQADAEAQAVADVDAFPDMVKAEMNALLDYGRTKADMFGSGSQTSTARPAILRYRKDVPDPIRALWGEVKDPRVNGAQALIAATQRTANKRFLRDLVEMGSYDPANPDKPFFLITKDQVGRLPNTATWEPVVSKDDNNEANPLAGLYGPPAVHEALREMFIPAHHGKILTFLSKATGYAMSTKTVQSPRSQFRNLVSNVLITMANGNLVSAAKLKKSFAAIKLVAADISNKGGVDTRKMLAELIELGVIHDSNVVGLLRDLHGELNEDMDIADMHILITRGIERRLRQLKALPKEYYKTMGALYQAGDDLFKMINFFGELHSLEWIYEADLKAAAGDPATLKALNDKIKKEAAFVVTRTVPTYSHVPELLRQLRRSPIGLLALPFVNWTAEIIRTSYNISHQGFTDLMSSNPRRQQRGAERIIGFGAALSSVKVITSGLIALSSAIAAGLAGGDDEEWEWLPEWVKDLAKGIADQPTDEEDRAFRETSLPPWSRNASLLYMGKDKDGNWRYQDVSFTDPYEYWKRIARSAWLASTEEGQTKSEAVVNALKDGILAAIDPFTGEQLLAGAVYTAINKEAPGQSPDSGVTLRTDNLADEAVDFARGLVTGTHAQDSGNFVNGVLHVTKNALLPGWVESTQSLVKGKMGVIEGGKAYDFEDEAANFFGIKVNKVNPMESAAYRLRELRVQYDDAARNVRDKTFADRGTAGGGNLDDALAETVRRQKGALTEARKTLLRLETLGVDPGVIAARLKEVGFRNEAIVQIMTNQYWPTMPSIETTKRAALSPGGQGQDRVPRLLESIHETKPIPLLDE